MRKSEPVWTVEQMAVLRAVQMEHRIWADRNFGASTEHNRQWLPFAAFAGLVEEIGEWFQADCEAKQRDALADAMIYLIDICGRMELQLADILEEREVSITPQSEFGVILGMMAHSMLKSAQGIRGNENHVAKMRACIRELVWQIEFEAEMCGTNLFEELLPEVWSSVKRRDWVNDPTGANH